MNLPGSIWTLHQLDCYLRICSKWDKHSVYEVQQPSKHYIMKRRDFIATTGTAVAGSMLSQPVMGGITQKKKRRIALVGTGIRGVTFWGKRLQQQYGDVIEFVGLSDINQGRLNYALQHIGVNCPTFVSF